MRRLLFDDPVTSLMTRLHGYVFEMSIFAFLVTQRQLPRGLFQTPPCKPAILFCSRFRRVTTVATDPATPAFKDPAIPAFRVSLALWLTSATTIDLNPHEVPRTPSAARSPGLDGPSAPRLPARRQPLARRVPAMFASIASSLPGDSAPLPLKAPQPSHDLSASPSPPSELPLSATAAPYQHRRSTSHLGNTWAPPHTWARARAQTRALSALARLSTPARRHEPAPASHLHTTADPSG
eukprot:scaffold66483_cov51-Phaeocystis_antarctica.AAC.1